MTKKILDDEKSKGKTVDSEGKTTSECHQKGNTPKCQLKTQKV